VKSNVGRRSTNAHAAWKRKRNWPTNTGAR